MIINLDWKKLATNMYTDDYKFGLKEVDNKYVLWWFLQQRA